MTSVGVPGCYNAAEGTRPPGKVFYFPVGLAVSSGGNVLYAVNSDFDLQWNGGTLQSYDLHQIRLDVHTLLTHPGDLDISKFIRPDDKRIITSVGCNTPNPLRSDGTNSRQALGETCTPPMDSTGYVKDTVTIGAFATDLQLSVGTFANEEDANDKGPYQRLFVPVRGDASLSWVRITSDATPPANPNAPAPSTLYCGTRLDNRCAALYRAGTDPNEPGNSRHITLPGEPFGMAQSENGSFIAITHQNDTKTSLFTTGATSPGATLPGAGLLYTPTPALRFIVDGLASGGNGIVAVPHDKVAFPGDCTAPGTSVPCPPKPAFLQTSRSVPELDLLRVYPDDGSSNQRPFIQKEATYALSANSSGSDSRGIVIDPTPRIHCRLTSSSGDPTTQVNCARKPARVFFANRTPPSLLVGEIGEPSPVGDGSYDADRLVVYQNIPLEVGPSRLYLAPIIDRDGTYRLRLFIVCFDAALIFVYDPDAGVIENIIHTAKGPFAMAFDPFDLTAVALNAAPSAAPDPTAPDLKPYRFAYVASFTSSFVQVIDLDNSQPLDKTTFEQVVYTLGNPTVPKGTR